MPNDSVAKGKVEALQWAQLVRLLVIAEDYIIVIYFVKNVAALFLYLWLKIYADIDASQ